MPRGSGSKRSAEQIPGTNGFVNVVTAFDPHFNALAADVSVVAIASADLATLTLTLAAPHVVQIWSSWAIGVTAGGSGIAALIVDGSQVQAALIGGIALAPTEAGAINWQATLPAGVRVVKVLLAASVGTLTCRPLAAPDSEFCNLAVNILNI